MARRTVLLVAGVSAIALVAGCSGSSPAPGGSGSDVASAPGTGTAFDWKQFSGQSIEVLLDQHPWQEAIEPKISQFEDLTGIKVNVTALPEDQFRQRVQVTLDGVHPIDEKSEVTPVKAAPDQDDASTTAQKHASSPEFGA